MSTIQHQDPSSQSFFEQIAYLPIDDRAKVREAFDLARREHGTDRRKSGELFFTHPLTVASYLAEYFFDASGLIAALLHDVAEDTSVSVAEIEAQFGKEVGRIVDGLTKFDRVTAKAKLGRDLTKAEVQNATLHKLFGMMAADVRVGIVKIFDRLHNMRTMKAMPPHKQREKARETLSVYAPLANRLGMWRIKNELETLSFEILYPAKYKWIHSRLSTLESDKAVFFSKIKKDIYSVLQDAGIGLIDIQQAENEPYNIFSRLETRGYQDSSFLEMPRLIVLLRNVSDCYTSLGHLHGSWRPVPNQFDDYIAVAHDNLYRSLHTTIVYHGQRVKVRIRTLSMQIESQSGVLAQWMNNTNMPVWSERTSKKLDAVIDTIRENVSSDDDQINDSVEFVINDVFKKQITVYTPNGDERQLPQGATPIDFAYKIHTDVGHRCRAAIVNGEKKPLTYELHDGDTIKIHLRGHAPQRAWLNENLGYLRTTNAKASVRRWFRRLRQSEAIRQGELILQTELKMLNQPNYPHIDVAEWYGHKTEAALYHALGRAEILPDNVAIKVLTDLWSQTPQLQKAKQTVTTPEGENFLVENSGQRKLRLCGTCTPRPGDHIHGYIRRDDSLTVHTTSCRTLSPDDIHGNRLIKLRWGAEGKEAGRAVSLQINVHDRDGLLNEITTLILREQINITMLCSRSLDYQATIVLSAEMFSPAQTIGILHQVQVLPNVKSICYIGETPSSLSDKDVSGTKACPFDLLQEGLCEFHSDQKSTEYIYK